MRGCRSADQKIKAANAAALGSEWELALTPVVFVILVVVMILVATLVAITVAVMIAVAWRLELSFFAQIAITSQYLPLVSSARLQPGQLQGVVSTSAWMIGRTPGLIAARNAIADMVGAGGVGGPVDHSRVPGNIVDPWAINNVDSFLIGVVHASLRKCHCRQQHQRQT